MSAVDDFQRDPPQFLRRNHVTFRGEYPPAPGVHTFLLVPRTRPARARGGVFLGRSIGKADAELWEIRYNDASMLDRSLRAFSEPFEAHWSGFAANGMVTAALGHRGPDLMLTPELTGCAVAFSVTQDGHARFSHYNMLEGGRTLRAPGMLAQARVDHPSGPLALLTKEHYHAQSSADMRDASEIGALGRLAKRILPAGEHRRAAANVVGWRRDGDWTFWAQYTDMKAAVAQVLDVRQLAPGKRMMG